MDIFQELELDKGKGIYFIGDNFRQTVITESCVPAYDFGEGPHRASVYTPNRFYKPVSDDLYPAHRRERFLSDIKAIAIDVDYLRAGYTGDPLGAFRTLVEPHIGSILPIPSYIEYGHQFRLIYVLREHIVLRTGTRAKWLRTVKAVTSYFARVLNEKEDICAEPQKPASFFRVPGSINEKTGDVIHLLPYSDERYSIQELLDLWMPEWKKPQERSCGFAKKRKPKSKKISRTAPLTLWRERAKTFEELRSRPDIPRQNLCFLYANALLWLGEKDVLEKVKQFNSGFKRPLPIKEITSKLGSQIKTGRKYKVSNKTINEMLGMEVEVMTKRERDKLEKIAAGKTRKQLAEKNYRIVKGLYLQGVKRCDIVKMTGLSVDTVKKYKKRMTAELNSDQIPGQLNLSDLSF